MNLLKRFTSNLVEISYNKLHSENANKNISSPNMAFGISGIPSKSNDVVRQAAFPEWMFTARLGQPRSINIGEIRDFSKSVWAQMVINTFRKQIFTTDWDIVVCDEDDENDYSEQIKLCKDFLNNINKNGQTINTLSSETVTDIAELDAGVWNFVYTSDSYVIVDIPVYDNWGVETGTELGVILKPFGQREIVAVKSVDGGSILKQVDIYKDLLRYYQYSFKHPMMNPTMFEKDEIEYMMLNSSPSKIYGFSPIQSAQQVLEALMQSTRWNKDLYKNDAIPDIIASLPKLPLPELEKVKRSWLNQYQGKPHQVGFINWEISQLHKLAQTGRDMEWLNGLNFYKNVIFAVFGVSPTEAGFFENSNRSNDQGQERVTVRNALRPYYKLFEQVINRRIIPEILQDKDNKIKFKWTPKDQEKEKVEFEQDIQQVKEGLMTPNEFRRKYGRDEKDGGDELRSSSSGFNSLPFNNIPAGNPPPAGGPQPPQKVQDTEDKKKDYIATKPRQVEACVSALINDPDFKPQDGKTKEESAYAVCQAQYNKKDVKKKDNILDAGDDIIDEASDYSEFLNKTFDRFEQKTLSAVDKLDKSYLNKTLGDFLRDMFNSVNTYLFASKVKKYLKVDLIAGLVSAESELNADIGFTNAYQDKLNLLASQQIDGYTINGKKWPGIKGVTKEIQAKVIKTVQDGVANNLSITQIKDNIKNDYSNFSDWRANMIARTETNRVTNEGKLLGYKETGMKGKKVWSAALDDRTSDICRRLNGQEQELDDPFIDPLTNIAYDSPPSHPGCRSVIFFRPE